MKIIAGTIIVLALVSAILPQFTDCESQGRALTLANGKTVPMKCHWTAIAALTTSVTLVLIGGLLFFSKVKETIRALSVLGLTQGSILILLPTVLIGVCSSPDMLCNSLMRPMLIFTGILSILASGIALFISVKGRIVPRETRPA